MKITGRITGSIATPNYKFVSPLFTYKIDQIQYYAEDFLRFIPRNIRNYPSHGTDHSINILSLIDKFLENWSITLSEKEAYLLYLAAWLHDIGIIIDRNNHNEHSANILIKSQYISTHLGREIQKLVGWVVRSHSKEFEIIDVPDEICEVRLQFICSIFRIMDACEIVDKKCPTEVFECIKNELNDESMEFWQAHMSIMGITYKKPDIIIYVTDINKSKLLITHLQNEIDSIRDIFLKNNTDFPVIQTKQF